LETHELIREKRQEVLDLAAKHGAKNVRLFGSVARGEANSASDIDFLVEFESGRSLLDLGGLVMDLQELLGREVDVLTEKGLRARIRERVLKEAVPLCDKRANSCWIFLNLSNSLRNMPHKEEKFSKQ
jgi:predicted nucleotidyltransferase